MSGLPTRPPPPRRVLAAVAAWNLGWAVVVSVAVLLGVPDSAAVMGPLLVVNALVGLALVGLIYRQG